jgi:hypothetical protein
MNEFVTPIVQEAVMGEIKIFVPDVLTRKKMGTRDFVVGCMVEGLSHDTAYRLAQGKPGNYTLDTIRVAAKVLGVASISEVADLEDGQH